MHSMREMGLQNMHVLLENDTETPKLLAPLVGKLSMSQCSDSFYELRDARWPGLGQEFQTNLSSVTLKLQ
jgi:hypothetical protein